MTRSGLKMPGLTGHPVAVALGGISYTLSQLPAWRDFTEEPGPWIHMIANAPLMGDRMRFRNIRLDSVSRDHSKRGKALKLLVADLLKAEGIDHREDALEYEGDLIAMIQMVSPDDFSNHARIAAQACVLEHLAALGIDPDAAPDPKEPHHGQ